MKEYTVLAALSVLITILIDKISKIEILKRKQFYLFLLIIFGFKFLVNGYLTSTNIVIYNPDFFGGVKIREYTTGRLSLWV